MARESKKLPFAEYRDVMSAEAVRYLQYEANAFVIRQVALERRARASCRPRSTPAPSSPPYGMAADRADKLVESRKERQGLFERGDAAGELLHHRRVGAETDGRWRQGDGSPDRPSRRDVRPARRHDPGAAVLGGSAPALAGPFIHLEFPAENDPDVIFVENTLGDTLLPRRSGRHARSTWTSSGSWRIWPRHRGLRGGRQGAEPRKALPCCRSHHTRPSRACYLLSQARG